MIKATHPETIRAADNVQFVEEIKPMTVQEYSVLKERLDRAENDLFPPDHEIRDPNDGPIRVPEDLDRSLERLRIPEVERRRLRSRILDRGVLIEDVPLELRNFSAGSATAELSIAVPWKDDHSMTGYIDRIETAFNRARGNN